MLFPCCLVILTLDFIDINLLSSVSLRKIFFSQNWLVELSNGFNEVWRLRKEIKVFKFLY